MPSTYAHYRMGQEVRSSLEEKNKKIVELSTGKNVLNKKK